MSNVFDFGMVATFSRREGRFFVRTEGPDGRDAEFEVRCTFAYELADLARIGLPEK